MIRYALEGEFETAGATFDCGMIELPFDAGFSDSDSLELAELSTVFPILF